MVSEGIETTILNGDAALREIVRRLRSVYDPEKIYLFGSKARSDSDLNSDYDLLVIVPETAGPERRRSRLAYREIWDVGKAADVLVCTSGDFAIRARVASSLTSTVLREGKLLYAA